MIVTLKELLSKAQQGGWAVPAFNVNNLEIIKAIMEAAEESHSPVIIQTSEGAIKYAGLQQLASLMQMAAVESKVPVVIHLDHGKDLELIHTVMRYGYSSVMYDGSSLPYEENVRNTQEVVEWAKEYDISVEAELGALKGIEDLVSVDERDATLTDPHKAKDFVQKTGIDALAVSIGTSHGAYKFKGEAQLDWERLKEIRKLVSIPLVLHGASAVSHEQVEAIDALGGKIENARGEGDEVLKEAVCLGISKVNTDTDIRLAFILGVRKALHDDPSEIDPRVILTSAMNEIKKMALQKFKLLGTYEKAYYIGNVSDSSGRYEVINTKV